MDVTLITAWKALCQTLAPAFTGPTAITFLHIATGWMLCRSKPTVTNLVRTIGDELLGHAAKHGVTYEHFFYRSAWSLRAVSALLLQQVVAPQVVAHGEGPAFRLLEALKQLLDQRDQFRLAELFKLRIIHPRIYRTPQPLLVKNCERLRRPGCSRASLQTMTPLPLLMSVSRRRPLPMSANRPFPGAGAGDAASVSRSPIICRARCASTICPSTKSSA